MVVDETHTAEVAGKDLPLLSIRIHPELICAIHHFHYLQFTHSGAIMLKSFIVFRKLCCLTSVANKILKETTEQEFTYLIEKHKSVIYIVCLIGKATQASRSRQLFGGSNKKAPVNCGTVTQNGYVNTSGKSAPSGAMDISYVLSERHHQKL